MQACELYNLQVIKSISTYNLFKRLIMWIGERMLTRIFA